MLKGRLSRQDSVAGMLLADQRLHPIGRHVRHQPLPKRLSIATPEQLEAERLAALSVGLSSGGGLTGTTSRIFIAATLLRAESGVSTPVLARLVLPFVLPTAHVAVTILL